ncbi:MAG: FAD-binding protein [Syntrophorhabdaceae bacterium]|nr:FAD-binding protein [Syntrophorhabdaceae bacterium]
MNWEDVVRESGKPMEWPYPVRYGVVNDVDVDVVVLGGGPGGCMAAISAAKKGCTVALLDKAYPKRSGGGSGFDHWLNTPNPASSITPEDCVEWEAVTYKGYSNSLSRYIAAREAYDTLLEIEKMGAKIRDLDDEFKGAPFRDEKTKFLFCYDYENRFQFRVWGATFKPAIFNECLRLGVQVFDRVVATSLLTEGGKQGARVVGATGINMRTGEFYVFRAKATINAMSCHQTSWRFSTESIGLDMFKPNITGDGPAIMWRAGVELAQMERSRAAVPPGYEYPSYGTGNWWNTWHPASMVDANGKEVPYVDAEGNTVPVEERCMPRPGQKFIAERSRDPQYSKPTMPPDLADRIRKGEFVLPFYADLAGMPWYERKVIWGLMVGNEGRTKIPVLLNYEKAGFNSARDMLQNYFILSGEPYPSMDATLALGPYRMEAFGNGGEVVVDWDLRTNLEGLYAVGDAILAGNYYYHACATGRYAGRKAAEYALKLNSAPAIDTAQIEREKARVYAPTERKPGKDWIDWKELRFAGARAMQNYCGGLRNEGLMKTGLKWIRDIKEEHYLETYASNPHILLRVLETYNILTIDEVILQACLARKASSEILGHFRQDYPEIDPPEWRKWVTIKQADGETTVGELPLDFHGNLAGNYEAHNPDYKGYLKKKRS